MKAPDSYVIKIHCIGENHDMPITEAEFAAVKNAVSGTIHGLGIEEKFDLVLENYAELERELLSLTTEHMVFPGRVITMLQESRHTINRRVVNLLTTTKLYLDQTKHDFSSRFGKTSEELETLKKAMNREYDSVLGYRVAEALRNVVQHQALPIHGLSLPMNRVETASGRKIQYGISPYLTVESISDSSFKTQVFRELEALDPPDGKIPLMPEIRAYIESIGKIHCEVRNLMKQGLELADELILSYRKKYSEEGSADLVGLAALALDDRKCAICSETQFLQIRHIERRKSLEAKNTHVDSISARFVSSA